MLELEALSPERIRPLKRVEYEQLVHAGAFEGERVELLHGTLVAMSPQDPGHTSPIGQLNMLVVPAMKGRALVRVQSPLIAAGESVPEPDFAIVPLGDYRRVHPSHALLVVEVAVSSMRKDRLVKAPLYARSGFSEYWLVDVTAQCIEVYAEPGPTGYATVKRHELADTVTLAAFPDVSVPVSVIFG